MPKPAALSSLFRALPWITLCLGLAVTYLIQDYARTSARNAQEAEFSFRGDEIVRNISARLDHYEHILMGVAGLFAASNEVDSNEFRLYIDTLHLGGKFPGIQGVGFSRWIAPGDKARHEAAVRKEGLTDYAIRPAGERAAYSSIVYLEPADWRNQRAIGYDMYSEAVRRAAMERARDENRPIISGKVRLVQETEQQPQAGFLMYLPVYRPHQPHETLAERRANLVGWVYAPFRMDDLMQGILGRHFGEVGASLDLEIYDGEQRSVAARMFDSNGPAATASGKFHMQRPLALYGHQWLVDIHSLPSFEAGTRRDQANLIALGGSGGSVLLAVIFWLLINGRARAMALAEKMTDELRQSAIEEQRLNRALRMLGECNAALVHAEDEYRLLTTICQLIVERGNYLMTWVGYAEHDSAKSVRPMAQWGYERGYLDQINVTWADEARGQGPTGSAIRSGQTSVNQDVLSNPRMAPWRAAALERGYRASIALPLKVEGDVLGALMIYAREADAFNPREVALLEELADDLAYGIHALRTRAKHMAAEERVNFLAHYDALTHLPNRVLLHDRFVQAAAAADEAQHGVAMLYLDLDNFQKINDSLGHDLGDRLLVAVVERLQALLHTADTISRLGGDEFVLLIPGIRAAADAATVADALLAAFAEPLPVETHRLNVSFSIGIGLFPEDGRDFDTLLQHADTATNNAKESGRNTWRFFTPQMNRDVKEQTRILGQLHTALQNNEFVLYYQPQVNIGTRRIIGAEALIRWQHPVDGLVPPGRFIPLAEQSGHIVAIGEWVLHEACRQAREWQQRGLPPLVVAVNFSALQFKRGNVVELVKNALEHSGLEAAWLEVELTESILVQDVESMLATLEALKALGVKLSIDDFGTGYSSMSYLKQLAVDKLKIDQSFIRELLTDADDDAIVRAIIELGHALQLEVIAEGVETEAQFAALDALGCDEVQGYLFSRPVPAADFAALLAAGVTKPA